MSDLAVRIDNATRRFGAVVAVHEASISFHRGRIHAVIGENGAGKSTLLGLAGGAFPANAGSVLVEGTPLDPASPAEATRRGVGFVHQHFMLVDAFTALENIMLGAEPTLSFGRIDPDRTRAAAQAAMTKLELPIDLDARVADLGVGARQNLEIVRVLVRGATTVLLDEPTAVLTPAQADRLFASLRNMAREGACVVVVTHRIAEVIRHCDDVTVMRRGRVLSTQAVSSTDARALTRAIMGAEPPPPIERPASSESEEPSLEVRHLSRGGLHAGRPILSNVSLVVPRGRILGIAGVEGNGQRELVRAIAGLDSIESGSVRLGGRDVTSMSVAARRAAGLSVVHDDRHREGLMLDGSVWDNLVLGDLASLHDEPATVTRRIERFGIVPNDPSVPARGLSGGNQQKLVVARALGREVRAAVLAQPTRGVDLGAARAIHEAICRTAEQGAGVLVVSADLGELRAICHEVLVIARGKITAALSPDATDEAFGRAMLADVADDEVA